MPGIKAFWDDLRGEKVLGFNQVLVIETKLTPFEKRCQFA